MSNTNTNTDQLIAALANDAPTSNLPPPLVLWLLAMLGFTVYGGVVVFILSIVEGPSDISSIISQPLVALELGLMVAILGVSLWSSVCLIYPDRYGHPIFEPLPFILLALLLILLGSQTTNTHTTEFMANMPYHINCLSCIVLATIIPAAALFVLTNKGATTTPFKSGCCAFLAATSISCIAIRLSEATGDMMHLILSHYMLVILSAMFGMWLGRIILKW